MARACGFRRAVAHESPRRHLLASAPWTPPAPIAPERRPAGRSRRRAPSPVMEQYIEIKAANPDCLLFYRMGDFYELFFEDAEVASRALGIVLTKRGKHLGRDIPMCGVPVHPRRRIPAPPDRARPSRRGLRADSRTRPRRRKRGRKRVVRRDVVRLVTPGTLTEDTLLDARRNNYLLRSRARAPRRRGEPLRARLDRHFDRRVPHRRMRPRRPAAEIARLEPGEIIVSDALYGDPELAPYLRTLPAVTPLTRDVFDGATAERRLSRLFRGRHHRGVRRAVAARAERRRGLRHLCRAHPARQAAAAVAAGARGGRRDAVDRPGDARQSRTDPHARAASGAARCSPPSTAP